MHAGVRNKLTRPTSRSLGASVFRNILQHGTFTSGRATGLAQPPRSQKDETLSIGTALGHFRTMTASKLEWNQMLQNGLGTFTVYTFASLPCHAARVHKHNMKSRYVTDPSHVAALIPTMPAHVINQQEVNTQCNTPRVHIYVDKIGG